MNVYIVRTHDYEHSTVVYVSMSRSMADLKSHMYNTGLECGRTFGYASVQIHDLCDFGVGIEEQLEQAARRW